MASWSPLAAQAPPRSPEHLFDRLREAMRAAQAYLSHKLSPKVTTPES
jgi:hypothetical protein